MLSAARHPETIHDFRGFPEQLYSILYPASGAPAIAEHAMQLLQAAGFTATLNGCRGLDHGAWVPLRRVYPDADVPVVQLSVQPSLDAAHHLRLGGALAQLGNDGVLVIGSGHLTHNLRDWMRSVQGNIGAEHDRVPASYVIDFREWIADALLRDDRPALVRWREDAPHAERAHPTPEHFMPLFVALGAAGERPRVERIDAGIEGGVLAMDAYVFWPQTRAAKLS